MEKILTWFVWFKIFCRAHPDTKNIIGTNFKSDKAIGALEIQSIIIS